MKKIAWTSIRVVIVALGLPFLVMKLISDAADKLLNKAIDLEDRLFNM